MIIQMYEAVFINTLRIDVALKEVLSLTEV